MTERFLARLAVVAFLVPLATAEATPIRVAVEQKGGGAGSAAQVVTQLNNDTYYDFTATQVTVSQIDTAAELAAYDVVIIGDSGYRDHDWNSTFAAALRTWVSAGKGVVSAGWADFGVISTTSGGSDLDEVMPIDAYPDSSNYYCYGALRMNISATVHAVTSGLPATISTTSADIEINPLPVDSGATILGTGGGSCTSGTTTAIVVDDYGSGRTVYLGFLYMAAAGYSTSDLRSGNADRLLEQAVNWAANGSCADADGDGATDDACGGTDCDDTDSSVYPGAIETCDGDDDDCDGAIDEGLGSAWFADDDRDAYGDASTVTIACTAPSGYVAVGSDCDDTRATVNPAASEYCNSRDDDCDGSVDESALDAVVFYADADRDAYGNLAVTSAACSAPAGYTSNSTDCDDTNAAVNPAASEYCNGVDDDCDSVVDDSATDSLPWYADVDRDAFGNATSIVYDCSAPSGYVGDYTDCNDANSAVYPGADEYCNGTDDDCDGVADDSALDASTWHADADSDTFGDPVSTVAACSSPLGYLADGTDCDDSSALVYPGAVEVAHDSIDQDCDGADSIDADLDGYAADFAGGDDCNDFDDSVFPGATETADGVDGDCDGPVDEGTFWVDDDGDGFTEDGGDCDDANDAIGPTGIETADGVDEDCDGIVDEGTEAYDDDGDGVTENDGDCNDGDDARSPSLAEIPANGIDDDCDGEVDVQAVDPDADGYTELGGDCDDANALVYPGAPEAADGVDNDCDGEIDEGTPAGDADADGASPDDGDCDDTDPTIGVDAPEVVDGVDNDCDGLVDEGTSGYDDDGDGFTEDGGDCDDADPLANPGAEEVLNGIDDDCDEVVDAGIVDADGDGYTTETGDCNDANGWTNPGMSEQCDGIDNDCDTEVDEDCDAAGAEEPVDPPTDTSCGCATGGGPGVGVVGLGLVILAGLRRRARAVTAAGRAPAMVALTAVAATACGDGDYGIAAKKKQLVVSPGLVDLGDLAVGSSTQYTISLTTVEGSEVNIIAVDVLTVAGDGFGPVEGELPTVALDETATLTFGFTATTDAWNRAQVTIRTDEESDSTHVVDVRVHSSEADLRLAPSLIDFGSVAVGDTSTKSLLLVNGGTLDLEVASLAFSLGTFTSAATLPLGVPAGETASLDVLFTPADTLPANGTVSVTLTEGADVPFGLLRGNDCIDGSANLYDLDGDGYSGCGSDCDDTNAAAHPGATESCEGFDEDCDGAIDNGTGCFDDDVDGYTEEGGDCNDNDSAILPGTDEVEGNGRDDNCDGVVDSGSVDADGDGTSVLGGDCDDADATVFVGAPELGDGLDNDCDGTVDEGTDLDDSDGDGYTEAAGDCDDDATATNPGAPELADWQDNNCDGAVDEGTENVDDDGDGFTEVGGDCNDAVDTVNPGERESTDGVDTDCNGVIDG